MRAVIVDDEIPALDRLKNLLKPYMDIEIVGEAHDGISALSVIEDRKPDVVFLDIDMPELNGLEVARTLGISGPLLVFVTAYDEHALEAFESNSVDYLVKPINSSRLDFAIGKIRGTLSKGENPSLELLLKKMKSVQSTRLVVKVGSKYEVFDSNLISAIFAQDHYISMVMDGRELLSDDSLETMMTRLDSTQFIRVHRSAILNTKFLKELRREGDRKFTAILTDKKQTQVPISRERLPQLKKFLGLS